MLKLSGLVCYNNELNCSLEENKKITERNISDLQKAMTGMISLDQLIEHGALVITVNYMITWMQIPVSVVKKMLNYQEAGWKLRKESLKTHISIFFV